MKYLWHVKDLYMGASTYEIGQALNNLESQGWEIVNFLQHGDRNLVCKVVCRKSVSPDVRAMCHAEVK